MPFHRHHLDPERARNFRVRDPPEASPHFLPALTGLQPSRLLPFSDPTLAAEAPWRQTQPCCIATASPLRKMRPVRQIEAAEHMRATGTYSGTFARALLQVTNPELLLEVEVSRRLRATSAAAQSMFAEEDASLVRDLKKIEESYGTDMLVLTVSCAYVRRLLSNDRVEQHLEKYHPDILSTLRTLVIQTHSS